MKIIVGKPCKKLILDKHIEENFKEVIFSGSSLSIFQQISKHFKKKVDTLEETKADLEYLTDHFLNNTYVEHSMTNNDGLRGIYFPNGICVISKELFEMETRNLYTINILLTSSHELCHIYKYYYSHQSKNILFKSTPRKDDQDGRKTKYDPQYRKYDEDAGEFYEESIFGVSKAAVSDKSIADYLMENKPWLNPNRIKKIKELIQQKSPENLIVNWSEISSSQLVLRKNKRVYCLFSFGEFEPMVKRSHEEIQKLILAHKEYLTPKKT